MSLLDDNKGVRQSAQEPNARNGDNQDDRVPTHEGSLLDEPVVAGETTAKQPHLQKEKGKMDQ